MKGTFESIVSVVITNDQGQVYTARMRRDADNRLAHGNERHFIGGKLFPSQYPIEQAAIDIVASKTGMLIEPVEALTTTTRSEQLPNDGGTRTVTTYWIIAKLKEGWSELGLNPKDDIEEGRWDKLSDLCDGNDNGIGDVAWHRAPMDLLMRILRS